MSILNRRHFLQTGAAAMGALAMGPNVFAEEAAKTKRSATDWVTLGKSDVKVTRLGMGTGTNSGDVQRSLGQKGFTELVRYAYDQGIRFFDTADNYRTHPYLAEALKGIDRSTYVIQTKMNVHREPEPWKAIDRFRKELNSDYFDSFLLHCATSADWTDELKKQMDTLHEAKDKEAIRSHGASVHGLDALECMAQSQWMDVSLLRVNHNGTHMDTRSNEWDEQAKQEDCLPHIRKIHEDGSGVIGMKLIGNGDFTDPDVRDASIKYVMSLDCVDAVIIGFKSTAEIDEAIERMNTHLNA